MSSACPIRCWNNGPHRPRTLHGYAPSCWDIRSQRYEARSHSHLSAQLKQNIHKIFKNFTHTYSASGEGMPSTDGRTTYIPIIFYLKINISRNMKRVRIKYSNEIKKIRHISVSSTECWFHFVIKIEYTVHGASICWLSVHRRASFLFFFFSLTLALFFSTSSSATQLWLHINFQKKSLTTNT